MSESWDEKHARNKGSAKRAFDAKAAETVKREPSNDLLKALEGLKDRRTGPADRRTTNIHQVAQDMDNDARNAESEKKTQDLKSAEKRVAFQRRVNRSRDLDRER